MAGAKKDVDTIAVGAFEKAKVEANDVHMMGGSSVKKPATRIQSSVDASSIQTTS